MGKKETIRKKPPPPTKQSVKNVYPTPPPLPVKAPSNGRKNGSATTGNDCASTTTKDLWDNLFDGGYRADVTIETDNGDIIYGHANVLGMASPVLRDMLKRAKGCGQKKPISIHGVHQDAVWVFIRFLYSSRYENEEMKEFMNFKAVVATQGWRTMRNRHPGLEKELLESVIEEENVKMVAGLLVHMIRILRRTCKGLELLVRHFAGCKLRVPGGCIHCKRMSKLLELYSRLCAGSKVCRAPLCRNFKEKIRKQSKKDEIKWKLLVNKILRTKRIRGSVSFIVSSNSISS
ncbi:BTB/POZ and TAZ domain-containing protein 4 [Hibiscus syriacus]|uniref:BTB/POZ and TAZ domain-containing protein 4 n=1 Tax=Hibiscus syriacus TaxID=106335 RepID=A0A6A2ZZP5_HIBSY|nr:BTB/POZ and TAZ domain-containing protein 4 [Hibiscus syriacus]